MDYYYTLTKLDWFSGSIELALAFTAILKVPLTPVKFSFFACALLSALWHISLPTSQAHIVVVNNLSLCLEGLRYSTWSLLLINLLMLSRGEKLPAYWRFALFFTIGLFSLLFLLSATNNITISP